MTDPLLAHATEYGRMYARSTTEAFSVPSITTVIGQQPHGLDGWFGYMGASSLAKDPSLPEILGSPAKVRQAVNRAAKAAEAYRDDAAQRGDRVHNYCEQVALRALGRPHRMKETREALGMSQARFAKLVGRSQSFVAKTELGERRMDIVEFIELADALQTSPAKLFQRVLGRLQHR